MNASLSKNQLDLSEYFDRTPTCGRQAERETDKQTDRQTDTEP